MQDPVDQLRADLQLHSYQIASLKESDEKLLEVLATLNSQLGAVDKHLAIIATKLQPLVVVQDKLELLAVKIAEVEHKTSLANSTAIEAKGMAWKAYAAIAAASTVTATGVHQMISFLWG